MTGIELQKEPCFYPEIILILKVQTSIINGH